MALHAALVVLLRLIGVALGDLLTLAFFRVRLWLLLDDLGVRILLRLRCSLVFLIRGDEALWVLRFIGRLRPSMRQIGLGLLRHIAVVYQIENQLIKSTKIL